MPGLKAPDGATEFVVVMARKDIVREYESACEDAGAQAGIVDLTTFNVINAVLAGPQAPTDDWLLVHVTPEDATMAILRGDALVFFRNRIADGEAGLADMVHQTAMYYEDRLSGSGFGRVVLSGGGSPAAEARRTPIICAARSSSGSAPKSTPSIRGMPRHSWTASPPARELLDALAPLVGLLARERAA